MVCLLGITTLGPRPRSIGPNILLIKISSLCSVDFGVERNLSGFHSFSRCDWLVAPSHEFVENTQLDHESEISLSLTRLQYLNISIGSPSQ